MLAVRLVVFQFSFSIKIRLGIDKICFFFYLFCFSFLLNIFTHFAFQPAHFAFQPTHFACLPPIFLIYQGTQLSQPVDKM